MFNSVLRVKTVLKYVKKLIEVVDKEVFKKTVNNTLNTKIHNLEKKNHNASTKICKNKVGDVESKIPDISGLATNAVS